MADFFAWANEQAALLRSGRLDQADIDRIAEEIESNWPFEDISSAAFWPDGGA